MKTTSDLAGVTVQELSKEYGWSPSNGYFTIRTWKGTQAEIQNLIPTIVADGYEYVVKEGPLWQIVAKTPQQTDDDGNPETETPIPVFELVGQRVDKNLLESDAAYVKSISPAILRQMSENIQDSAPPTFLSSSFVNASEKSRALDVYLHSLAGVNTYTVYVPVLRKTYIASNKYIVNEAMNNVNRVFSTGTLIGTENVPYVITGILPSSGTSTTIVPTFGLDSVGIITNWGWLKACPQYQQIGANQFQITVDYEFNRWSENLYGIMI